MKFTVAAVLAFAAMAVAYPNVNVERRQSNTIPNVDASIPAMSDQAGNVIPFDSTKVYKDATAKGL
ncbi:hypothetical protein QBC47DRAFT_400874 [Echria macrotheca]|uniref:Uncharacterized protein n=1 Tax=Echria macrotheca TaxID=438768 RepID=A0AAJ0FDJ5_9PEZI|nr:hypothetical protein QBC47DRAFT_400874 [Echria macrotheca]